MISEIETTTDDFGYFEQQYLNASRICGVCKQKRVIRQSETNCAKCRGVKPFSTTPKYYDNEPTSRNRNDPNYR